MASVLVFSPCTAAKDDRTPIPSGSKITRVTDYLKDEQLRQQLLNTRDHVLVELGAQLGCTTTYALDLYAKTGRAYKALRCYCDRLKEVMLSESSVQWFFLSGGYGVIHALEEAVNYQASFSQFPGVLRTDKIWQRDVSLSSICDAIVERFRPSRTYAFGSSAYTRFIKQADLYSADDMATTVFESSGPYGSAKLSPTVGELARAIVDGELNAFSMRYPAKSYHADDLR